MRNRLIIRILSLFLLLAFSAGLTLSVSAAQQWNMEYFLKKYADSHFDLSLQPNRVMSTEEFIAVIYAYSYYGDGAETVTATDRDGKLPSAWAGRYVQAEVSKGVITPGTLSWSQPATLAFAAEYLCRSKGKFSYDAVNSYAFTGTDALTADQKLYLCCAVDWGLIPYTPGMNASAPIYRKDARRYEVPEGNLSCKAALAGSTTTMREQHAYFVDSYWDLDQAERQFAMLQALANDVTMVTFQCAYWNGSSETGTLTCNIEQPNAGSYGANHPSEPQLSALAWCKQHGKLTFLGVSNAESNSFVSEPVRKALGEDPERAADELLDTVNKYGLDGVNMGIELGAQDADLRDAYARFLTLLGGKLHAQGKLLLTSVGAYFTDAQEQAGFYDYSAIGSISDYVHVILYDDFNDTGYPYRKTDGAISNLTRFGRCLRYASVKMPRQKLLAGLGAYAIDFDLTAVTAEDIPYESADMLRRATDATVLWDSNSASAFFSYHSEGHDHRVWLETADSIAARVKLLNRIGVCGMSFYYIGTNAPQLFHAASELASYKPEVVSAIDARLIPNELRKSYDAPITRREFCTMIAAFLQRQDAVADSPLSVSFSDCSDASVRTAATYGIVNGYNDGTFRPNNTLSRQEAATMLMRLAKCVGMSQPNGQSLDFSEYAAMQDWAKEGVRFISACQDPISEKRVMNGTGARTFSPLSSYTREQSAMTMIRLYRAVSSLKSQ